MRWWVHHPWLILLSLIVPFALALALSHLLGTALVDLFRWSPGSASQGVVKWGILVVVALPLIGIVPVFLALWAGVALVVNSRQEAEGQP